jgi:hypothetical protein
MLNNAPPPVQYRAIIDVAKLSGQVNPSVQNLPYAYRPALELAVQAAVDGVWNRSILAVPSQRAEHCEGVGTVPAFRRLTEYGWDKDAPPLVHTRRVLFRLLAEDTDRAMLYELAPSKPKIEEEHFLLLRQTVREGAGAALAGRASRVIRGLARRTIDRMAEFLRSPLAEKPWIRVGNKQVLHPDAFPPTIHILHLLAHMPLCQSEHYEAMELLYEYLTRPLPRQEAVQQIGTQLLPMPLLVLGDLLPHRNAVEDDVPAALAWLELMAQSLGFCGGRRRGRDGVWHKSRDAKSTNPYVWPMFPLTETHGGDERWCDVTFRIGLIARLSGRPVDLV